MGMKKYVRENWKPLAIWSGLGSLFFGGAFLAYKKGYVGNPNPAVPIPEGAEEVILHTHAFEIQVGEQVRTFRCIYHLQATRFRIWSVLEGQQSGHPVYFITPTRYQLSPELPGIVHHMDSFYAAIGIPRYLKRRDLLDHVRKDSPILFHLAMVGGGSHAIPTGEKVISSGTLADWEIDGAVNPGPAPG
jgi:hypothetical protein